MQLLLEGLEEIAAAEAQPPEPMPLAPAEAGKMAAERAARRPRLPEHLPVKETILDPDVVQAHSENWIRIGEEVSEQLDYTPASFVRLRLVRPKYVSKERRDLPPVIAPLPPSLQERCLAAPSLLAHCMVSRYRDHLPWHRLEQIYAGLGVKLSRQTLCNWSGMAAGAVQLVVKQIAEEVFADGYVQMDETPVEYLSPGTGKPKTIICGWRTTPPRRPPYSTGGSAGRRSAFTKSSRRALPESCSATATAPTTPLRKVRNGKARSASRDAGPMCGAGSSKPANTPVMRHGCWSASKIFMLSRSGCGTPAPDRRTANLSAANKAVPW